jgi:hypothetical protein
MKKFIAWNLNEEDSDIQFFETEEEAKEFCLKEGSREEQYASEGWAEHVESGGIGYAKIRMDSALKIVDAKTNYKCSKYPHIVAFCSSCSFIKDDCDGIEEWTHGDEINFIYGLKWVKK